MDYFPETCKAKISNELFRSVLRKRECILSPNIRKKGRYSTARELLDWKNV